MVWKLSSILPYKHRESIKTPLVFGDYADPSILRDGEDYYLVHSVCGSKYRLMPLWHSKDLVHWELLYHVLEGAQLLGRELLTAWAPDLVKYQGKYYIYNYSPGFGVWVTMCDDIAQGNWSEPELIEGVDGIDPGHFADDEGNRYLCLSKNVLYPLSKDGRQVTGEGKKICENWPIPETYDIEGMCTEAPKFFKKDGWIYFLTAQGGTMGPPTSHCVVAYRARSIEGPYEVSPYNPIVHTGSREHLWWSTGHGSLVDTPNGKTFLLYHGILKAHRYIGRQTLMMPVSWKPDGWFTVSPDDDCPQTFSSNHGIPQHLQKLSFTSGGKSLGLLYNFDEAKVKEGITFEENGFSYRSCGKQPWSTPALTFMPQSESFEYTVEVTGCSGGFAIGFRFTDTINCGVAYENGVVRLFKHAAYEWSESAVSISDSNFALRMRCCHGTVSFWIASSDHSFHKIPHSYDVADWNPNVTQGFSYVNPCVWSFGEGQATVRQITYQNLND